MVGPCLGSAMPPRPLAPSDQDIEAVCLDQVYQCRARLGPGRPSGRGLCLLLLDDALAAASRGPPWWS